MVQSSHGVAGWCGQHDGLAATSSFPPGIEGLLFHAGDGSAVEAAVLFVEAGDGGVAVS